MVYLLYQGLGEGEFATLYDFFFMNVLIRLTKVERAMTIRRHALVNIGNGRMLVWRGENAKDQFHEKIYASSAQGRTTSKRRSQLIRHGARGKVRF